MKTPGRYSINDHIYSEVNEEQITTMVGNVVAGISLPKPVFQHRQFGAVPIHIPRKSAIKW